MCGNTDQRRRSTKVAQPRNSSGRHEINAKLKNFAAYNSRYFSISKASGGAIHKYGDNKQRSRAEKSAVVSVKLGWRPAPATPRHPHPPLPLLPSGPDGVNDFVLRGDQRSPP